MSFGVVGRCLPPCYGAVFHGILDFFSFHRLLLSCLSVMGL